MRSRTTKEFRDLLASLPEAVQRQARDAYDLFRLNPFHPGLNFKSVSQRDPDLWSVRVGDAILWIWLGSHAEYDRELRRS